MEGGKRTHVSLVRKPEIIWFCSPRSEYVELLLFGGRFPRVFGDKFGEEFCDKFGDEFSESPNLVMN